MYEEYWNLARMPFGNTPDPEFFYQSAMHRNALNWILYGIRERKGAVVLTGDVGCGKTVISRKVIRELSADEYDVAVIVNPSLSPVELLREILHQLGCANVPKSKFEALRELNQLLLENHRKSRHTVILIDEAQAIRQASTLEELRLLLNFQLNDAYLLTLVLIGQPEWADRLGMLPQLQQRIAVRYDLHPLAPEETERYVTHRIRAAGGESTLFTPEALRAIHSATGGTPRRINNLCDQCLLIGYQAGTRSIDDTLVRRLSA